MNPGNPTSTTERIESLDVLRGFALLGILLLNILGFGMHSAAYFNPLIGIGETELSRAVNVSVWATVSVLFEGAMRCLFSMLFGAGVVLFTTGAGAKRAALHYKRNFWLLVFGVFNAYVLLWEGDILITYALVGALLYPLRHLRPRTLLWIAGVVLLLNSAYFAVSNFGLSEARAAGDVLWKSFASDYLPDETAYAAELAARRDGYWSAAEHNLHVKLEIVQFVLPVYLLWDALAMMLIGMALYKLDVLGAARSFGFYLRLTCYGFGVGLTVNLYELWVAARAGFDILASFPMVQPTYHLGRLGMALGYLGLVMIVCKLSRLPATRARLAAVGRMALTNYLLQSFICLVLFTGAGFGLVGALERWELYPVVLAIWAFQLWWSPRWLRTHRFGPMEWLWRTLTYGASPAMKLARPSS